MIKKVILLCILSVLSLWAEEKKDSTNNILKLLHADGNSNKIVDGAMVSTLFGNVHFLWGDIDIQCDTTIWTRSTNTLNLIKNVVITRPGQLMKCGRVDYNSELLRFELMDSVHMVDTTQEFTMTADSAHYYNETDSLFVYKDPKLHFWSSTSPDTFTMICDTLHYSRKTSIAQAIDSVKIIGPALYGTCDSAYFYDRDEWARLIGKPHMTYETSEITGDSLLLYFNKTEVDSFLAMGEEPLAIYKDTSGENDLTTILKGDSILFYFDNRFVDTIITFSRFLEDSVVLQAQINYNENQIVGDTIIITFDSTNLKQVDVFGKKPEAVYLDTTGRDSVTTFLWGDEITFHMDSGTIEDVVAKGSGKSEQVYHKDKEKTDIIWGDTITSSILDNGARVRSAGEARAIYRSDGDKQNEVAGDTLTLYFDSLGVAEILISGGVQGVILDGEPKSQ